MRTSSTVDEILQSGKKAQNFLQNLCGLPVSTYFSALKIKWIMDNVPGVKEAMDKGRCIFGNIDSWLVWVSNVHKVCQNIFIKHILNSLKYYFRILQAVLRGVYT